MNATSRFAAILMAVVFQATVAVAGSLIIDESHPECTDWFEGTIEAGDVVQFYERYGYPVDADHPEAGYIKHGGVLCLDSPGGNYIEALEIAEFLLSKLESIATRVMSGDECASACALVFLAGKHIEEGETYTMHFDRSLDPDAKLGFHAPSLGIPPGKTYTSEQLTKGFNLAITASRRAYELSLREDEGLNYRLRNFASPYVMARFLGTPPEDMYFIDTVGDALLADIVVSNLSVEVKLDKKLIRTICDNVYMMSDVGFGLGVGAQWKSAALVDAKSLLEEYKNLPFNQTQGVIIHPGFDDEERPPFEEHIEATGDYGVVGYATGYPDYYIGEAVCVVRIETSNKPGETATLGQIERPNSWENMSFENGDHVRVFITERHFGLEDLLEKLRGESNRTHVEELLNEQGYYTRLAANPLIVFPFGMRLEYLPRLAFDLGPADCEELWYRRNLLFHSKGYCFSSEKAIEAFGNEGCSIKLPELTDQERSFLSSVQTIESELGCVKP